MVSIQPGMIVRYYEDVSPNKRYSVGRKSLHNLSLNHSNNDLSDKARKRIRKAVNWMVAIAEDRWYSPPGSKFMMKVKIVFVTITLPSAQQHCDKVITKECLNQLLIELKKYHGVRNYVWKAEAQENGNLHYHIAVDSPVDYDKLKDRWNRIIGKLGYIDEFQKSHGHRNPNSTDIHKVKDVENIAGYISQYMAKKELRRPMCGKYWGCSQQISRCESIKLIEETEVLKEVTKIERMTTTEVKQMDYCQLLFNNPENWMNSATPLLSTLYKGYIELARHECLESKVTRKNKEDEETEYNDVTERLIVDNAASELNVQVEQLSLIDQFFAQQQKSNIPRHTEDQHGYRYRSEHEDLHASNSATSQKLYIPPPDYHSDQ